MGLFGKALAMGFGYVLAQPQVRQKVVEWVRHPKVQQGRDQVQELATNGLRTAKHRLNRSSATDTVAAEAPPTPLYAGVRTPSPTPRASDRTALREGVVPRAQDAGGTTGLNS